MTRVGWCPGGRPVADMLALYPGTTVVRIFVGPGDPLPAWDGPVLGPLVDQGVIVHLSYKTNELPEVRDWARLKPSGVLLILTRWHEPEQGTDAGDPTVEQYRAGWAELLAGLDGHPARPEILLGPVYTRRWWEKNPGDLRWLLDLPVDVIGWDIYNNGSTYRTPDDLLTIPRQIAAQTGLPYLIAELGAVRVAGDTTGAGRSAWMRAMVAAARGDGALTVCWYHRGEWDLTGTPEQQTWQTLIQEEAPVTRAPETLLAARRLLLDHLDVHPGETVSADLDPAEVGIVGDPDHRGGYHCGADRVVSGDYSVVESSRDSRGLAEWACALDVGQFSVRTAKGSFDLRHFSRWLVAQCIAGTLDTRDIREVIYSPDGTTVRRWDRLGKRSSGDSSHLTHTHISYHRDAIKAGRDQVPLFRRYLTDIGSITEGLMALTDAEQRELLAAVRAIRTITNVAGYRVAAMVNGAATYNNQMGDPAAPNVLAQQLQALGEAVARESSNPDEIRALLAELPQPAPVDPVDEQAIVQGVLAGLAGLDLDSAAAALRAAFGDRTRDLAARLVD